MKLSKRILSTLFVLVIMLVTVQAQSRYKHVPRVKVDVNRTKESVQIKEPSVPPSSIVTNTISIDAPMLAEENNAVVEENIVASVTNEPVLPVLDKKVNVKLKRTIQKDKKVNKQWFTQKVKNQSRLLDVKDAEKTNANIALILLIVFYILAFIFILIAVLMILGAIAATLGAFYAMLIIGIVFALAASILLTLIKLGVV